MTNKTHKSIQIEHLDEPYVNVPNSFVRSDSLSSNAKILMIMLKSHSEKWKFNQKQIASSLGWGEAKLTKHIKELEAGGYLSRKQPVTENGAIIPGPWIWQLSYRGSADNNENPAPPKIRGAKNSRGEKSPPIRRNNNKKTNNKKNPLNPPEGGSAYEPIVSFDDPRLDKDTKIPFLDKFVPSKDIKDFAYYDLRMSPDEIKESLILCAEYWRSNKNRKNGKKKPLGWNAALKNWLRKEAVMLKAKWRDKPFDPRVQSKEMNSDKIQDAKNYPKEYWELHVRRYSDQGDWSAVGPKPDEQECLAPDEILKKYDFSVKDESQG